MPTPRYGLSVAVVDGVLYAVGGGLGGPSVTAVVEAYTPATNTWVTKAALPTARYFLGSGVVNGKLYAVGGNSGSFALNTVEAYQP